MWVLWGILVGLIAGVVSGFFGIGGATILTPILIYVFKMGQHMAQGTSLAALLLPVGLLAFLQYYKAGNSDIKLGLCIAVGLFLGGYFGGMFAQKVNALALRKAFAVYLIIVGIQLFFKK
ncbi:MAG TPA: sulfite exporter TauE/SafE family protein [Candidatus Hydrothermia bacterium]|nr:sulfite exporter TauE/SafE family protein [Candidatus Hydrothermia bacterium]MDD5573515.1 sulfite exporter TauE/SafE family protein [Candidatus Hydrothermia bacterium]HOK23207.1 sulfite exporter TauE/SafE family protein [Candidatus Hydrothermia bacterium]HOL23911.1 sulfite exporter TauE/SafE family protein [Candidatus Hydrothermia bacterium]HOP31832.1 sulfite exporter TauE/SafE family protein [Candidatus Hydrothermia bacterium]